MTTLELAADKNIKKHVAAIHISNRLSFLERKMSNVMLWNAYDELMTKKTHRIRVKDLAEIIGFDSNDRGLLKESLKNLIRTVLEWNVIDEKGREKDWEACSMLEYARIQGQYCHYSYSDELRKKFYNPEMYERINLSIQRKFSSGYALALYENCLRFRKLGCTGWIPLETFRSIMGVSPKEYADFRRLNTRVIKGPVEQVNQSSDILLTPEYQREKRRISAVRFKVQDNPQISLFRELAENQAEAKGLKAGKGILTAKLLSFGLTPAQVETVTAGHDETYLQEILRIVERDAQGGKVDNLPAYTLAAIKHDFRPKPSPYEAGLAQQKQAKQQAREALRHQQEQQEAKAREQEVLQLQQALEQLSPAQRKTLEARFQGQQRQNPVFRKWQSEGLDHPVIRSLFRVFAKQELLDKRQVA